MIITFDTNEIKVFLEEEFNIIARRGPAMAHDNFGTPYTPFNKIYQWEPGQDFDEFKWDCFINALSHIIADGTKAIFFRTDPIGIHLDEITGEAKLSFRYSQYQEDPVGILPQQEFADFGEESLEQAMINIASMKKPKMRIGPSFRV